MLPRIQREIDGKPLSLVRLGYNLGCIKCGALSSDGRASALHAECRRFDPVSAHQISSFILPFKASEPLIPLCLVNYGHSSF